MRAQTETVQGQASLEPVNFRHRRSTDWTMTFGFGPKNKLMTFPQIMANININVIKRTSSLHYKVFTSFPFNLKSAEARKKSNRNVVGFLIDFKEMFPWPIFELQIPYILAFLSTWKRPRVLLELGATSHGTYHSKGNFIIFFNTLVGKLCGKMGLT